MKDDSRWLPLLCSKYDMTEEEVVCIYTLSRPIDVETLLNILIVNTLVKAVKDSEPKDREDFLEKSCKVALKDLANEFNLMDGGDYISINGIRSFCAKDLRISLMKMGFAVRAGSHNLTYLDKTPGYRSIFEINLRKYGSGDSVGYYFGDLKSNEKVESKTEPDIEECCSEVTLVTRTEGEGEDGRQL